MSRFVVAPFLRPQAGTRGGDFRAAESTVSRNYSRIGSLQRLATSNSLSSRNRVLAKPTIFLLPVRRCRTPIALALAFIGGASGSAQIPKTAPQKAFEVHDLKGREGSPSEKLFEHLGAEKTGVRYVKKVVSLEERPELAQSNSFSNLDQVVAGVGDPNLLLENQGDGTFQDRAEAMGSLGREQTCRWHLPITTGSGADMELRDERVADFVRRLARGKHSLTYRLRAEVPGKFSALPANGNGVYAPELRANSDEMKILITDEGE